MTGQATTHGHGGGTDPVIRDGLAAHLPDIDPEETAEWLESFDAVLDAAGQQRARYLMLRHAAARPRAPRRRAAR